MFQDMLAMSNNGGGGVTLNPSHYSYNTIGANSSVSITIDDTKKYIVTVTSRTTNYSQTLYDGYIDCGVLTNLNGGTYNSASMTNSTTLKITNSLGSQSQVVIVQLD